MTEFVPAEHRPRRYLSLFGAMALLAGVTTTPHAQEASKPAPDFATLEAEQNAANSKHGPRSVPARVIPVPTTVSPGIAALIAAPYSVPFWNANAKTPEEWKKLVAEINATVEPWQPIIRKKLGVTIEKTTVGGVNAYVLTPKFIPRRNRNRLLLHFHGGAYIFFPGEAGTGEAALMAGFGGYKVISIDYRMAPDFPYPAALDDAMAAYRAVLKMQKPRNVGVFGTSTGGGMTLAVMLRAKKEGVPLPGAIAPGSPWADLTDTGDTYKTNEWVDNVIVSYEGLTKHAAALYAGGRDLKDPMLSPIYGDYKGFPPAILTSGTRDLLLSLTVLAHRKLRNANIDAQLQVFEGMSHAQYLYDMDAPETREAFAEIAKFFDKHLGKK